MKKLCFLFFVIFSFSCIEETPLTFTEINLEFNNNAIVEINVPHAESDSSLSKIINTTIENHIANTLNFSEDDSDSILLNEAINKFDAEYKTFKNDFEESALVWEAMFDGEVIYQSSEVISIAINSYLNTGGAHGNMNVAFLNFDPKTGDLLEFDELISNKTSFLAIAQEHFNVATQTSEENNLGDYFFDEDFHLPANIGFNDEGIILFYNIYEIASYAIGITEFTIPYDEVSTYLNIK